MRRKKKQRFLIKKYYTKINRYRSVKSSFKRKKLLIEDNLKQTFGLSDEGTNFLVSGERLVKSLQTTVNEKSMVSFILSFAQQKRYLFLWSETVLCFVYICLVSTT